jgi:hypothetical protein
MQVIQTGGVTQLCRSVEGEGELGVERRLGPQRAVVVEYRHALRLFDVVGRLGVGHGNNEVGDRLPGRCLPPAR